VTRAGDDGRLSLRADAAGDAQADAIKPADAGRDVIRQQNHSTGQPLHLPNCPAVLVEAMLFGKIMPKLRIKKVDFLAITNEWCLGTIDEFSKMLMKNGVETSLKENMGGDDQD
jgi:hypothetical protein